MHKEYDRVVLTSENISFHLNLETVEEIKKTIEKVSEARVNEYYSRNPYTSISKVKKDFLVGRFCEQGVWQYLEKNSQSSWIYCKKPDFEFHEDNIHGSDLIIENFGSISVKGTCVAYNNERSWIYQPDKLRYDESWHVFVYCHTPESFPVIEICAALPAFKIPGLLKEPFKSMGGKMAIYERDIISSVF